MSDLDELYQQVILDHNRRPRNFGKLEGATKSVEGFNPLCGDHITVHVLLDQDRIQDITFEGSGCAIAKASASIMTESVKGKTKQESETLFSKVHTMLTTGPDGKVETEGLGKLAVFAGVREFPVRVKCASLAWHTLHAALEGEQSSVTTE